MIMKIKFLSQLKNYHLPNAESMIFSLHSPNLHDRDNTAADYARSNWLPLQPISINLSRLPKVHPSKRLVSAEESENSGLHNSGATATDGNIDAEIDEIKKEIRRLSVKLSGLRTKKADKDLRAATAKPFATNAAVTGCEMKAADVSVGSSISRYRRRGLSPRKSEKEGKPRKRILNELKKGVSTVGAKAQAKTVNANLERKNLVTGEEAVKNNKVKVVASRYNLRSMQLESKRRS
ncbi:hypothetical protein MA16_Dca014934 [Dendrobium catenatum]|uniref:Uncharacterized protein n=1 Tax=Dendrobium catenatum TaxID=906689 RepID=A0A2I0W2U1_9ASPA|nr:hypothetical protein MA16_Dca014934 [Dendrobium catenatum]